MTTLEDYKGLKVLPESTPPINGGEAISDDLRYLVDWNPKSNWEATGDPTDGDDEDDDYQVGSLWFNTNTGGIFVCVDATSSAAVWRGLPFGSVGFTASITTTNNTLTQLFLLAIPGDTTWGFEITTVARRSSPGGDSAVWESKGAIKNAGLGATLVGSVTQPDPWRDSGASSWELTVSAVSGVTNALKIEVKGQAAPATVDWLANIRITPLTV